MNARLISTSPGGLSGKKKEQALARKEQEFRDLILKAYRAEPLPDAGFFHGKNGGRLVVVGPINLPVGRLFVEEVIIECRKRGATRVDVLAFEFEMGLFPAVLDEAKQKGHRPRAQNDSAGSLRQARRRERARCVSLMWPTSKSRRASIKKDKMTLAVELTDFSVYYSQGIADSIAAEMKEGKSEVVCEQGQLLKLSKDKARRHHPRRAHQTMDGLGGLLGRGFRLREPQGNHQRSAHRLFRWPVAGCHSTE